MVRCFSYIVVRDYGFAPNPFHGIMTLATCKPKIRRTAQVGDYIIGHASKKLSHKLIFMMKVTEITTFDKYWNDERFQNKKPIMNGSLVTMYGDNIYHKEEGVWHQADSHHSLENGEPNPLNVQKDTTTTDRVLISGDFIYLGASMQSLPKELRGYIQKTQGHRCVPISLANTIWSYLCERYPERGLIDDPLLFKSFKRYDGKS